MRRNLEAVLAWTVEKTVRQDSRFPANEFTRSIAPRFPDAADLPADALEEILALSSGDYYNSEVTNRPNSIQSPDSSQEAVNANR